MKIKNEPETPEPKEIVKDKNEENKEDWSKLELWILEDWTHWFYGNKFIHTKEKS